MTALATHLAINWQCKHSWRRASINTAWCLLGCSIGDLGTIASFQFTGIPWPTAAIMALAIVNGLMTSIALETVILRPQMGLGPAFRTAIGMSFISMVAMEVDECDGCVADRRREADVVGCADHAARRLFGAVAV